MAKWRCIVVAKRRSTECSRMSVWSSIKIIYRVFNESFLSLWAYNQNKLKYNVKRKKCEFQWADAAKRKDFSQLSACLYHKIHISFAAYGSINNFNFFYLEEANWSSRRGRICEIGPIFERVDIRVRSIDNSTIKETRNMRANSNLFSEFVDDVVVFSFFLASFFSFHLFIFCEAQKKNQIREAQKKRVF